MLAVAGRKLLHKCDGCCGFLLNLYLILLNLNLWGIFIKTIYCPIKSKSKEDRPSILQQIDSSNHKRYFLVYHAPICHKKTSKPFSDLENTSQHRLAIVMTPTQKKALHQSFAFYDSRTLGLIDIVLVFMVFYSLQNY